MFLFFDSLIFIKIRKLKAFMFMVSNRNISDNIDSNEVIKQLKMTSKLLHMELIARY